jgi:hypothetical protein
MGNFGRIVVTVGAVLLPASVMAGGYGTAGVKDATVSQSATSEATIWCPKLKQEIPLRLQQQMDCGEDKPAGEKGARQGFFSAFHHIPQGNRPSARDDNDKPSKPRVVASAAGSVEESAKTPVNKLERLEQLNVSLDSLGKQSPEFQEQFNDFYSANGPNGDWSKFEPK